MEAPFTADAPLEHIYLDKAGHPICVKQWQELRQDSSYCQVRVTQISGYGIRSRPVRIRVHTVWTGVGDVCCAVHNRPTPLETRVFDASDFLASLPHWAYDLREPWTWETLADAQCGHEQIVAAIGARIPGAVVEDVEPALLDRYS